MCEPACEDMMDIISMLTYNDNLIKLKKKSTQALKEKVKKDGKIGQVLFDTNGPQSV